MSDPNTGAICIWPLFKTFLNDKKIHYFLIHENKYISQAFKHLLFKS